MRQGPRQDGQHPVRQGWGASLQRALHPWDADRHAMSGGGHGCRNGLEGRGPRPCADPSPSVMADPPSPLLTSY